MSMRWRIYAITSVIIAIMLASMLFVGDTIDNQFSGPEGLDRLRSYGDWAWLVGIALIVSDLFLPVPAPAVITLLGMLYGPWLGGFIGGVGTLLAGLVAYGGCRLLGDQFVRYLVGTANLVRLNRFFSRHGLWAIALTRWMPLLPEALCCLAGMSRMRFWPMFAALTCGSFPMGFTFAFLGEAYLERPVTGLLISAMIPLVIWPPMHYLLRRTPSPPGLEDSTGALVRSPKGGCDNEPLGRLQ
jgi:uncharacterized membrane protein YdjX (TVP38/TMEM64 family)